MALYRVGIVGATGVVGQAIMAILAQRSFPIQTLRLFASERSMGRSYEFRDTAINVERLCHESLTDLDILFFSAGSSVSREYVPVAAKRGIVCIDNTSHFRMVEGVPLIVPEVNPHAMAHHNGIIANPNCSTAQMMVVLKPILDAVGLTRLVIATYQSVSGAGSAAMNRLASQSSQILADQMPKPDGAPVIAFNAVPHIDDFLPNGYTKEEMKMVNETKKILGQPDLAITATTVRIPVFVGHSEAINIEVASPITPDRVRTLLNNALGVTVMDDPEKGVYPTPRDVAGHDDVLVGRIRQDVSKDTAIELWCVGDNLRKGAALNAVQIAELLV